MIILVCKENVGGIIIRNMIIKVADEKDLEFVEGLHSLGINRNVSKLITYLKDVECHEESKGSN